MHVCLGFDGGPHVEFEQFEDRVVLPFFCLAHRSPAEIVDRLGVGIAFQQEFHDLESVLDDSLK